MRPAPVPAATNLPIIDFLTGAIIPVDGGLMARHA